MQITIFGRKLLCIYHHNIMNLDLSRFIKIKCDGYNCRDITESDINILKLGDFSIANMLPYLRKERKYATGLLFFDNNTKNPVGYIWVVRRGGNDMTYRVRKVDGLLSCVCVFKNYRGKNIANIMIGEVVSRLKLEHCNTLDLGVNRENNSAIRAYEKAGFRKVDEKCFLRILRVNFPYHTV